MAEPTILRGSDYFFINTYEGNGVGQRVGKFVPFTDNGTIAKSAIFDNGGPAYLDKTYGSAGTSLKKFTFSCWFKIGADTVAGTGGYFPTLFNVGGESGKYFSMFIQSQYQNIQLYSYNSGYDLRKITNRTFEDPSKWYHIVCAIDTTESTGSDRVKLYIDGDRVTSFSTSVDPSQDYDLSVGAAEPYYVGFMNSGDTWDGYIAEANYVDGTALTPSTFGLTDTSTGRWIPKTLTGITYGSNGFRMQFANSAGQTIGDDTSGNGNDFTVNNMDASDITTDSPTQNHFTIDPGRTGSGNTLSEGNLKIVTSTSDNNSGFNSGKLIGNTGKYYFEAVDTNSTNWGIGINAIANVTGSSTTPDVTQAYLFLKNGTVSINGTQTTSQYSAWSDGATLGIAIDMDNKQIKLYVNNSLTYTISNVIVRGREYFIMGRDYSGSGSQTITLNFGQKSFTHTPPTGFVALQQDNLPETAKGVSGLVWNKNRDSTYNHGWWDSSRGAFKFVSSNTTTAEQTALNGTTKFLKGGYTVGAGGGGNNAGDSIVAWNWVANGGTTSANTDGSGATQASTIQANQTAGFSIVTFSSSSAGSFNNESFAHGLSQAPEWVIYKRLDSTSNWVSYHKSAYDSNQHGMFLDTTAASAVINAETTFFPTAPTSSVFSYTNNSATAASANFVAYCWHGVPGYSKFGSYIGNGNSNGALVYTGFKPSWIMIKRSAGGAANWYIIDTTRNPINPTVNNINADTTTAESGNNNLAALDILSNGFKNRQGAGTGINDSGSTYIYMAFAEHPFAGTSSINPVTAR